MSAAQKDTGVVSIHGKEYKTVARRLVDFRTDQKWAGYSLETNVEDNGECVLVKAIIRDTTGKVVSTGHGDERRGSTNINKTSAVENAETSAVGRALALLHPDLAGTEIASADEVVDAMAQQGDVDKDAIRKECWKYSEAHMQAFLSNLESVMAIKKYIAEGSLGLAREAWQELDPKDLTALWVAPTKGGVFTTIERQVMKSPEWTSA